MDNRSSPHRSENDVETLAVDDDDPPEVLWYFSTTRATSDLSAEGDLAPAAGGPEDCKRCNDLISRKRLSPFGFES